MTASGSTSYSDGVVTIRRQESSDLDADLAAKDDEQIEWLWLPGQRRSWEAMTAEQQRAHALRGLERNRDDFGPGPKWAFSVDLVGGARYVTFIECNLADGRLPPGEANIAYASHPQYRGGGYVTRAVRLVLRFIGEHTAAKRANLLIDPANTNSLRVAQRLGAVEAGRFVNQSGRTMIRFTLELPPSGGGSGVL
ncbi:MAG: hypothetical protein JWL70_325 [Acidimicrobiia bacterium]|nr:hypothetical protein [Acidimicrobiia bacterium]